jgi:hypothetical protein
MSKTHHGANQHNDPTEPLKALASTEHGDDASKTIKAGDRRIFVDTDGRPFDDRAESTLQQRNLAAQRDRGRFSKPSDRRFLETRPMEGSDGSE